MNVFPKVLIFFLLFMNAAYYYSNTVHKQRAAEQVKVSQPTNMKRLVLLSERTAGAGTGDAKAGPETETVQPAANDDEPPGEETTETVSQVAQQQPVPALPGDAMQACYTLGPLASDGQAREHSEELAKEGYVAEVRSSEEHIQRGYWVMLPPFLSKESANKALGNLKRDGIKDVALITSGEFENSVSVGLFTVRETALKRQKELLARNYQTLVRERHVTRTNYWLDVTGPQQQLARRLETLSNSGETLGIATCRSGKISGRE